MSYFAKQLGYGLVKAGAVPWQTVNGLMSMKKNEGRSLNFDAKKKKKKPKHPEVADRVEATGRHESTI